MSTLKIFVPLLFFILLSFSTGNSRIAFSRPGNMLRIPNMDNSMYDNLFSVNIASEILSSTQSSNAIAISMINNAGYQYGISMVKPVFPENSIEMGFHLQKNLLIYGNTYLDIGLQDILYRQGSESDDLNGLDTKNISFFTVLSNKKNLDEFAIASHIGLGTGKINQDSHLYVPNPTQNISIFLGFNFTTPILKQNGGTSFITEFDGNGINLGLNMPILRSTFINFCITNFENFGNFATEDKPGTEKSDLVGDAPSITLGISFNVPKIKSKEDIKGTLSDGIYSKTDSSILYYEPICDPIVETLRDSIRVAKNIINNLDDHKNMLQHSEAILIDSTRKYLLQQQVSQSNQNKAMRHLSRSLRFFYEEDYRTALSEINLAIELNPDLAIAYGRRGSIYFKLGDTRRATLNWNVALQLDPEFTEIYNMLQAAEENRLKPVEISKNIGEIK